MLFSANQVFQYSKSSCIIRIRIWGASVVDIDSVRRVLIAASWIAFAMVIAVAVFRLQL